MNQESSFQNGEKPVAIVTGGARRIGKAISFKLAELGYDLQIWCNSSFESAHQMKSDLRQKFNSNVEIVKCDLFNQNATELAAQKFIYGQKNISLLVNNSSIIRKSDFLGSWPVDFLENLNIHLIAPMLLSHAFAKNFFVQNNISGQVINILDKSITRFETANFNYLLTKKFLCEATKMLALQLAPKIRVNAIAPATISIPDDQTQHESYLEKLKNLNPMQVIGKTSDITSALEFLLKNHFLNGQILFVDGASSLNHGG